MGKKKDRGLGTIFTFPLITERKLLRFRTVISDSSSCIQQCKLGHRYSILGILSSKPSVSQSREVNRCLCNFTEAMARCSYSLSCCVQYKHIVYTFTLTAHITPFSNWKVEVKDSGFFASFFFFFYCGILKKGCSSMCQDLKHWPSFEELPVSILGAMKCVTQKQFGSPVSTLPLVLRATLLEKAMKLHPASTEAPVWGKATGLVIWDSH